MGKLNTSGIYMIKSKVKEQDFYIGSSVNIGKRWSSHVASLRTGNHHSTILQNHVNKYGLDSFEIFVIEPCDKEDLLIIEQHYIDTLNPSLNVLKVAGSAYGHPCSEETRRKIGAANKGKPSWRKGKDSPMKGKKHTQETLNKMSLRSRGRIVSQEVKEKIGRGNLGKKRSEEDKEKISRGKRGKPSHMQGKKHSEESKNKMMLNNPLRRCVYQYDKEGNLINSYPSLCKAASSLNAAKTNISRVCNMPDRTAYGFVWKTFNNLKTNNLWELH